MFQFHIGAIKIQKFACKTDNLDYLINKFILSTSGNVKNPIPRRYKYYIRLSVVFFSIPIISRPLYFKLPRVYIIIESSS